MRHQLRALRAIGLFLLRRTDPTDGELIGYGRGLTGTAIAFVVVTLVETVVLHLLVPVAWLRTALVVLGVVSLVAVLGLVLARTVYPHVVAGGRLQLRSGARDVVSLDLADVGRVVVRRRIGVVGIAPTVVDGALCLPSQDGTNLDLELVRPVVVPDRKGHASVQRVSLHVDDPAAACALLSDPARSRRTAAS